ncbi:MAG: tetratricopeptide repeat protein [Deltaproteobacteria bacterium]|nr:tetratricopeptide repeat protein [Deltaproteobacteria bacterium]
MAKLVIGELPSFSYPKVFYSQKKINRSGVTVENYFKENQIVWRPATENDDVWIRKTELSFDSPLCEEDEKKRIQKISRHPNLFLIPETREAAPIAYRFADPAKTFCVCPGDNLKMLHPPSEWTDPQLENWNKRQDRACWIGRPTLERIEFAKMLLANGVALDIFSEEPWPLSCWKGKAPSDIETARTYKYRFVFESSLHFKCHSEKLFLSLLSGCVSFYIADPTIDLKFLNNSYLNWNPENWKHRNEIAGQVIERMHSFLFSSDWEIYSYKNYFDTLIAASLAMPEVQNKVQNRSSKQIQNHSDDSDPESKKLFDQGIQFFNSGDYPQAILNFKNASAILGPIFFIDLHLGVCEMRLGNFIEAERFFKNCLERYPFNHECLINLAVLKTKQNQDVEAVKLFEEVVSIYPNSGLGWRNLGRSLAKLEKFSEARIAFEAGLKAAPHDKIMQEDLKNLLSLK